MHTASSQVLNGIGGFGYCVAFGASDSSDYDHPGQAGGEQKRAALQ